MAFTPSGPPPSPPRGCKPELFLIGSSPDRRALDGLPVRVVRVTADPPSPRDMNWLGRHPARTKIGLALGAGGAKSFAHVGVLQALEAAGFTVDYVAGTSMGALVAAGVAMGRRPRKRRSRPPGCCPRRSVAATSGGVRSGG